MYFTSSLEEMFERDKLCPQLKEGLGTINVGCPTHYVPIKHVARYNRPKDRLCQKSQMSSMSYSIHRHNQP